MTGRRQLTSTKPHQLHRQQHLLPEPNPTTGPSHRGRSDGLANRADSCSPRQIHLPVMQLHASPRPAIARTSTPHKLTRRFFRKRRWRGSRLLPYMDDLMFIAHSSARTLLLRDRVQALLHRLGLQRNPKKGLWEPTQVGDYLGLTIDL
jgi:hypothetical protein